MKHLNLGQLIDRLESCDPDEDVRFDFGYFRPADVHSYRGFYEQLAIGYTTQGDAPTVAQLLDVLRDANGKTFQGYKGGEYEMHDGTPMWVANHNEACSVAVVNVTESSVGVVIHTAYID